jgi:hypothetical protein
MAINAGAQALNGSPQSMIAKIGINYLSIRPMK